MDRLHWSLEYQQDSKNGSFRQEFLHYLSPALASPPVPRGAPRMTHGYTLLQNFWSPYKDTKLDPSFHIGYVSVERARNRNSLWSYNVTHRNEASGEKLSLEFMCADDAARSLQSPWRIISTNDADGSYNTLAWTGNCTKAGVGRVISLESQRGLKIESGILSDDTPLTCNWALVDILSTFGSKSRFCIALLEDLEALRRDCCVRPLEEWRLNINGGSVPLCGYTVSGTGFPPTYWWLTETGEVIAFATTFATYVLTAREG